MKLQQKMNDRWIFKNTYPTNRTGFTVLTIAVYLVGPLPACVFHVMALLS